jgi:hypothetical protein
MTSKDDIKGLVSLKFLRPCDITRSYTTRLVYCKVLAKSHEDEAKEIKNRNKTKTTYQEPHHKVSVNILVDGHEDKAKEIKTQTKKRPMRDT